MLKNIRLVLLLIGLIIIAVVISVLGSQSKGKAPANQTQQTAQTPSNTQAASEQSQPPTAEQIADGINLQTTGANYGAGQNNVTYGFTLSTTDQFTGTVDITLGGSYGNLPNALTFTENDLAAGASTTSKATWSGHYTSYNYDVTIDGQTFSYTGGSIPTTK